MCAPALMRLPLLMTARSLPAARGFGCLDHQDPGVEGRPEEIDQDGHAEPKLACRSVGMDGIATLTIATSRIAIRAQQHQRQHKPKPPGQGRGLARAAAAVTSRP